MTPPRITALLGLATLAIFSWLNAITPLEPAPCGMPALILCLELPAPGDPWATVVAAEGLHTTHLIDFGFMVVYSGYLAALAWLRLRGAHRWAVVGLAGLACALDGVENTFILEAIASPELAAPRLVFTAASVKFATLGVLTAALATAAPEGSARWVERVGAVLALLLVLTPVWRQAVLIGVPGMAIVWIAAFVRLVAAEWRTRNGPSVEVVRPA